MPKRPTGLNREERAGGRVVWRGWAFDPADGSKRRGPWRDTMGEAVDDRQDIQLELRRAGGLPTPHLLLRDAVEEFLAGAEAGTVRDRSGRPYRPSTVRGYRRGWAKWEPEIGRLKLTAVRRSTLQRVIDRWVAAGKMKPSTVRNSLDPLRAVFRRAVQREWIAANPTADLDVPREDPDEAEIRFASRDEGQKLLAAVPEDDRALWATALYAGLRRGELRALRVNNLDLGARLIKVRRSWDDNEGEGPTKTKAGRRDVPIIEPLRAELAAHLLRTGRRDDDLIFGETASHPFTPSTVRRRARKAWTAAKLEPITLHQCRHTAASWMIAAGSNAKALSVVLGHASIAITFDRYGHLMPGGESEVGRLLEAYISGPVAGQ